MPLIIIWWYFRWSIINFIVALYVKKGIIYHPSHKNCGVYPHEFPIIKLQGQFAISNNTKVKQRWLNIEKYILDYTYNFVLRTYRIRIICSLFVLEWEMQNPVENLSKWGDNSWSNNITLLLYFPQDMIMGLSSYSLKKILRSPAWFFEILPTLRYLQSDKYYRNPISTSTLFTWLIMLYNSPICLNEDSRKVITAAITDS